MINLSSFPNLKGAKTSPKAKHHEKDSLRRDASDDTANTHSKERERKREREQNRLLDADIYITHAYAVRCARVRVGDKKANWGKFGVR
jgi:hypothetical protein